MMQRHGFTRCDYDSRFGAPATRTFRRDLSTLRDAGLYVTAPLARSDGRYTMTAFFSDREAA